MMAMLPLEIAAAIDAAFALLPPRMGTLPARVVHAAIGWQESAFEHRRQIRGPARGLWQFEQGGGVVGVLRHAASCELALQVCDARGVVALARPVYLALESDDVLAAALARLLLWTDPAALPALGDVEAAWQLYLRTWRPGAVERDYYGLRRKWSVNYARALEAYQGAA